MWAVWATRSVCELSTLSTPLIVLEKRKGGPQISTSVSIEPVVHFTLLWEKGQVIDVSTNSASIDHFLDLIKMSRADNTWLNHAHGLKLCFQVIPKSPEAITRADCLAFMKQQDESGLSDATINRRLAAVSALFNELQLLGPTSIVQNPVHPRPVRRESRQRRQSLYRKQAQRVPSILSEDELQTFLGSLPSWRDRTLPSSLEHRLDSARACNRT